MKLNKNIIILTIILGLITTGLFIGFLGTVRNAALSQKETIEVVVASQDIDANTRITSAMITVAKVPKTAVRDGHYAKLTDVVGLITKSDILKGEQIIEDRLALRQEGTGLAYQIPDGMRAMSLPITETSGVAGYVNAGDLVDILVTYPSDKGMTTYTQIQKITVLAKGINPGTLGTGEIDNSGLTTSLTLLLTPDQAEILSYALLNGTINLTLRNPSDGTKITITEFGTGNFNTWKER